MTFNVHCLWSSVTNTTDGATSSYGVSGASGLVLFYGRLRSVGVAFAFNDLKGTVPFRAAVRLGSQRMPSLGSDEITANIGFAYQLPPAFSVLRIVQSRGDVPGLPAARPGAGVSGWRLHVVADRGGGGSRRSSVGAGVSRVATGTPRSSLVVLAIHRDVCHALRRFGGAELDDFSVRKSNHVAVWL